MSCDSDDDLDFPIIGYTDENGDLVQGPFDANDAQHIAIMSVFAQDCAECRAVLEKRLAAVTGPFEPEAKRMHNRARRRRRKSN